MLILNSADILQFICSHPFMAFSIPPISNPMQLIISHSVTPTNERILDHAVRFLEQKFLGKRERHYVRHANVDAHALQKNHQCNGVYSF